MQCLDAEVVSGLEYWRSHSSEMRRWVSVENRADAYSVDVIFIKVVNHVSKLSMVRHSRELHDNKNDFGVGSVIRRHSRVGENIHFLFGRISPI